MKRRSPVVVLFAFLALLTAAGLALAQTGDSAQGQAAWDKERCRFCHGNMGEGKHAGPRAGDGLTAEEWITQVRTPRNRMPSFTEAQITDQTITDLQAYMQTLPRPADFQPIRRTPAPDEPAGPSSPQDQPSGRRSNCGTCWPSWRDMSGST